MLPALFSTVTLLVFVFTGCCGAAFIPSSDGSQLDTHRPLTNISLALAKPPTTLLSNDIQIQCRGSQFGFGLSYRSCLDAFSTFDEGASRVPIRIGRRVTDGYARYLPWKWVSGRLSKCSLL